jgi:hypothetical protein
LIEFVVKKPIATPSLTSRGGDDARLFFALNWPELEEYVLKIPLTLFVPKEEPNKPEVLFMDSLAVRFPKKPRYFGVDS